MSKDSSTRYYKINKKKKKLKKSFVNDIKILLKTKKNKKQKYGREQK